jgi:hypothetical protein
VNQYHVGLSRLGRAEENDEEAERDHDSASVSK